MNIEYRFVLDESYARESYGRIRTKLPLLIRASAVVPVLIAMSIIALYVMTQERLESLRPLLAVPVTTAVIVSLMLPVFLKSVHLKNCKKSSQFDQELTTTLSEAGIESTTSLSQGTTKWAAISSAIRHSDGIVLQIGRIKIWLPDSALQGSSSSEATEFVSAHTKLDRKT